MNQVASRIHKALEENELGVVRELPNELLLRSLPRVRVCSDPDSILFVSGRRAQSLKPSWTALQSKAGFDGDEKREYAEVKLTRAVQHADIPHGGQRIRGARDPAVFDTKPNFRTYTSGRSQHQEIKPASQAEVEGVKPRRRHPGHNLHTRVFTQHRGLRSSCALLCNKTP